MKLRSAYLIRYLSSNQSHCFILEEVSTRKRRQFDSMPALLVHLQEILPVGEDDDLPSRPARG